MGPRVKRAAFIAITVAIPVLFLAGVVALFKPALKARLKPALVQYLAGQLSPAERGAMLAQLAPPAAMWDAVPDPEVGGLGQRGRTLFETGTAVRLNNAGLRDSSGYGARRPDVFRIVCLGDSFVFGTGGAEPDRFCDQLEAFYREHQVSAGGRRIETLAVGLPSWTLAQAATYLAHRITSYDPDVVVVLSVANDITDNFGVNGAGTLTSAFSPESRALGSAVYSNEANVAFGDIGERSALTWNLGPESRRRWDKALQRLRRLAELQQARGKQLLASVMTWGPTGQPDYYATLFGTRYARAAVPAPLVLASFLPGSATSLPHDNHPNRAGHRLLRDQYVHALHRLGWVPVADSALPALDPRTPLTLNAAPDSAADARNRQRYLRAFASSLDFGALRPRQTRAFLGGLFPENPAQALAGPPWASLRASFLLRRPARGPLNGVEVEIQIPPYAELFPFDLKLLLDGRPAAQQRIERPNENGRYRISGAPAGPAFDDDVVEVTLETGSYFSTIDDARMKSYRPLRARAF